MRRTITLNKAKEKYEFLYFADLDEILEIDQLSDIIKTLNDEGINIEDARIYGVNLETAIKIDTNDIVETACMELDGDLFDVLHKEDLVELQTIVDEWTKNTAGLQIYTPDYSVRVNFRG